MQLPDFALVTLYALGLRQLLFEYKKTRFIRDFLLNTPFAELTKCVYCQSIECVVVVLFTRQYIEPVFIVLAVGFVAIALDAWIYQEIANMEKIRTEVNHETKAGNEGTITESDQA
jgi:type III secretory pathway component EscU